MQDIYLENYAQNPNAQRKYKNDREFFFHLSEYVGS